MKQDVADLFMGTREHALRRGFGVKIWIEHVAGWLRNAAVARERLNSVHLREGNAEAHSLAHAVLEHDAHISAGLLPRLADAVDVPAATHEHVSHENAAAGEVDEHPLATRFDAVDLLAGERGVVVKARDQRVIGTETGDGAAHEGTAQCTRGAKDGIAFGHFLDCSERVAVTMWKIGLEYQRRTSLGSLADSSHRTAGYSA